MLQKALITFQSSTFSLHKKIDEHVCSDADQVEQEDEKDLVSDQFLENEDGTVRLNTNNIRRLVRYMARQEIMGVISSPAKVAMRWSKVNFSEQPQIGEPEYIRYYKEGVVLLHEWLRYATNEENLHQSTKLKLGEPQLFSIDNQEDYNNFARAYQKRSPATPSFWAVTPGVSGKITKDILTTHLGRALGVSCVVNLRSKNQMRQLLSEFGGEFRQDSYFKEVERGKKLSEKLPGVDIGYAICNTSVIEAMIEGVGFRNDFRGMIMDFSEKSAGGENHFAIDGTNG